MCIVKLICSGLPDTSDKLANATVHNFIVLAYYQEMGSSVSVSKTHCDDSTKSSGIIDKEQPFLPEAPPELYRPASFDEKMYEKVCAPSMLASAFHDDQCLQLAAYLWSLTFLSSVNNHLSPLVVQLQHTS